MNMLLAPALSPRLHNHRTVGGHCIIGPSGRAASASRFNRRGKPAAGAVSKPISAVRYGAPQLRRNEGVFPPAVHHADTRVDGTAFRHFVRRRLPQRPARLGVGTLLLPYLEQDALYEKLDLTQPCWSPAFATSSNRPACLLCPSASGGSAASKCNGKARHQHGSPSRATMGPDRLRRIRTMSLTPASISRGDEPRLTATTTIFPNRFPRTTSTRPHRWPVLIAIQDHHFASCRWLSHTVFIGEHIRF